MTIQYPEFINPDALHDDTVNNELRWCRREWDSLPIEEKQWAIEQTYFTTDRTRFLLRSLTNNMKIVDGKRCVCIAQHPLLTRGTAIRKACLLAYYHFSSFRADFNLYMGKLNVSSLAHATELLPPDHVCALFATEVLYNELFHGMIQGEHAINEPLHLNARLSIRVDGFYKEMTLESFVHWTALCFDRPLSGETLYGEAYSSDKELVIDVDNCLPLNRHATDARKRMGKDANHIEVILRGLQIMALQESVLEHGDDWTLVDCVFK